jgi:hypothetical protein
MPKWVDSRGCNSMTAMNRRVVAFDFGLLLVVAFSVIPRASGQATYTLKATPKTVAWGYYDAKAAPVLRVKSGAHRGGRNFAHQQSQGTGARRRAR